jgi:heme/copper-type cytochrome/quinol oxidase subunit 3
MSSEAAGDLHAVETSTGIPNKKILMWAFLASDCMFFGALLSTHLIYRLHPAPNNPDPRQIFDLPLTSFSTFVLLMSSLMMALAVHNAHKGEMKALRWCLVSTIALGLVFLGCQAFEFNNFVMEHHMTLSNCLLGSTFFTLTGTHGLHVLIGVVWLTLMFLYSFTGNLRTRDAIDVEIMGLYWHFVDIVWIVIFTAVYLLEYV